MEKTLVGLGPVFFEFLVWLRDSFFEIPAAVRDEVPNSQLQDLF